MDFALLIGLALALLAGAGALMWRRLERMSGELKALRAQLAALESVGAVRRRVRSGESLRLAPVDEAAALSAKLTETEPATIHHLQQRQPAPAANADTLRGVALALAAAAPALCLAAELSLGFAAAIGVALGGAMMLLALRKTWPAAAWAGVITAGAWSALAFALDAAAPEAGALSAALAFAGAAGLAQAFLLRLAPGAALTLLAGAAALALGAQIGLISPAGAAFGAVLALAATVGALNLRLEAIHLAAFGAALIGLFVLSGQDSAAIWFTPVAAWTGALFLGIAAIRVPDLGARGIALAGSGVLAPLFAIAALHWSGHGLASPLAAAGALLASAAAFGAVIAAAAARGARTLASLKLTLWVLAAGVFMTVACAIVLMGAPEIAALAFMAFAAGLLALDWRWPDSVWRALAWCAGALALLNAGAAGLLVLREAGDPIWLLGLGFGAPLLLAGVCAYLAERQPAPATAGLFEALLIVLTSVGASLTLRVLASGGALVLTPISFPEAGLHIASWLVISLLAAARMRQGVQSVRAGAAMALGALALAASLAAMLLWLTPYWTARAPSAEAAPLLQFAALGFLAPAIMFWAHWVLWRGTGANLRTRLSLGAGALMLAAMATLLALQASEPAAGPDWVGAIVG
ncbi:MAG TPA: hypothetical protein PLK37_08260, partial [Terricaulis sp.]|nr:hypothetical protein [Terricaulis sp.]